MGFVWHFREQPPFHFFLCRERNGPKFWFWVGVREFTVKCLIPTGGTWKDLPDQQIGLDWEEEWSLASGLFFQQRKWPSELGRGRDGANPGSTSFFLLPYYLACSDFVLHSLSRNAPNLHLNWPLSSVGTFKTEFIYWFLFLIPMHANFHAMCSTDPPELLHQVNQVASPQHFTLSFPIVGKLFLLLEYLQWSIFLPLNINEK